MDHNLSRNAVRLLYESLSINNNTIYVVQFWEKLELQKYKPLLVSS